MKPTRGDRPSPALVAEALAGGEAELDRLARAWLPHVYAWCHRLGGPGIDAEDAAHEVLIVLCRRLAAVRSPEVFPSWLFGVCRGTIANHRRRAWLRRWVPGGFAEAVSDGPGPEGAAFAREIASAVWEALDELPAAQREVLVLCELEDHTGSEAAELIGVPVGTVKSRLRAAHRSLRAAMGGEGWVGALAAT